jgi:ribosomal protein S18 acetylase RimI-like enzyme
MPWWPAFPAILHKPPEPKPIIMSLHITPLLPAALPLLQDLWNRQLAPHMVHTLAHDLQSPGRAHGQNVAMIWRAEQVAGCVAWVTLGIAEDGCAYGSPLIAADVEVATALIGIVSEEVRAAGAQRLRISVRAGENAKREGLQRAGFGALFEFVNFSHALPLAAAPGLPAGLHAVASDAIDWDKLHACYAETFAGVPNSPIPAVAALREEWLAANPQASLVLADASGEYQAFALVDGCSVEGVGVRHGWRGRGLAEQLYQLAAAQLAAQGKTEIQALVAAGNAASMRLHQKLGFSEYAPRWTVYELRL